MKIEQFLKENGFTEPRISGDFIRTNAIWRGGKGHSVSINKRTGFWKDFVSGSSGNFAELMRLCGSKGKLSDIQVEEKILESNHIKYQTFSKDILIKLKKEYHFYTKRGISAKTLEEFNAGVAQTGDLYNRIVFPIFNHCNQIIGCAGRKLEDKSERPKWQFMGKRDNWIFPCTISEFYLKAKGEIILVESIGDALALWDVGIQNVLCTFGLHPSKTLIAYLIRLNPDRIIISLNNDMRGRGAILKAKKRLKKHFLDSKIKTMLPPKKDWADSSRDERVDRYRKNLKRWLRK